jgi:hypothetical protein
VFVSKLPFYGRKTVNYFIFALNTVVLRKIISYLILASFLATGPLAGCTAKTPQQKKTASLKRKSKLGNLPCPCDSN